MVSASTRRLPSTTMALAGLRRGMAGGRNRPYCGAESTPARTKPTRQRPRSCRTHKFMRNAPFPTLNTD